MKQDDKCLIVGIIYVALVIWGVWIVYVVLNAK